MKSFIVIGWFTCGALGFGLTMAFFQEKYAALAWRGRYQDLALSIFCFLAGPAGLFAAVSGHVLDGRPMRLRWTWIVRRQRA